MRTVILTIAALFSFSAFSQIQVTNASPNVFLDSHKFLYSDVDNPIIINTGDLKSVRVSVVNGSIKKTKQSGRYLVRPGNETFSTTIVLIADKYRKEFTFQLKELPIPQAYLSGPRNEDGMIMYFKESKGVMAFIMNLPIEVLFKVDSFRITLSDSLKEISHNNIGAAWDSTTRQMINDAKSKTTVTIQDVYVTGPGQRYCLREKVMAYIR